MKLIALLFFVTFLTFEVNAQQLEGDRVKVGTRTITNLNGTAQENQKKDRGLVWY